ncbi:unnamed protein product, partial [Prorocentrum cordatum]
CARAPNRWARRWTRGAWASCCTRSTSTASTSSTPPRRRCRGARRGPATRGRWRRSSQGGHGGAPRIRPGRPVEHRGMPGGPDRRGEEGEPQRRFRRRATQHKL